MAFSEVRSRTSALAAMAGLLGAAILLAGVALSIAFYNARSREPYSLLNHFISELGWARRTPMAWVFNGTLVIGTLLFAPLVYALGRHVGTRLGYVGMGLGFFALIAGGAVGLVPLDHVGPHLLAAVLFFMGWLAAVAVFTAAFWLDKSGRFPRHLVAAGIVAILVCAAFLVLPKGHALKAIRHPDTLHRPQVWLLAVTEWGVFLSIWVWMVLAAWYVWRSPRPRQT